MVKNTTRPKLAPPGLSAWMRPRPRRARRRPRPRRGSGRGASGRTPRWRRDVPSTATRDETASRTSSRAGTLPGMRWRTRTRCAPYPDSIGPCHRRGSSAASVAAKSSPNSRATSAERAASNSNGEQEGIARAAACPVPAGAVQCGEQALAASAAGHASAPGAQKDVAPGEAAAPAGTGRGARPGSAAAAPRSAARGAPRSSDTNSSFCRRRRRMIVSSRSRPSASASR